MRILVIGAGALGGYFGGRLLAAGRDVTFLVRPRRAAQLAARGLEIVSLKGGLQIANPPTVTADKIASHYDLILLSCKAFDLTDAIKSFAPAVGPETMILPVLNGLLHLDILASHFGAEHVLGGWSKISATLDDDGRVHHLSSFHAISFGEQDGTNTASVEAVAETLGRSDFDARLSDHILAEMWNKWVFIAAAASLGSLLRAQVGDIVAAGAESYGTALLEECAAIAARHNFPQDAQGMQFGEKMLSEAGSEFKPSMLRDIERGQRTEAHHIVSDLLRRRGDLSTPILQIADAHLKVYEVRRARESGA
ncbi:2-dehydropantoate 2-reductase [Methylovirgula ligni]|uniref:2-dehydropantoate 2-reductase n=1 Tax=Methylovirgula ligni TaxID=569860 RepID=A0A3D9Z024_9HYPH|nr:ketopantoate reductase family protein [Methylovirgula ligni]QAY96778.1 2-dehydropantoate 2-reductase [Methylovirgula ligni]REF88191.1 ketopantoate reductase [Methylovirgula ligni]